MYPEIEIIKKCQSGEESAYHELIKLYHPHIVRYLSALGVAEGLLEDIVQETFLKLVRSIERFKVHGEASFSTWLFCIARNCMIDELRRNRQPNLDIDELAEALSSRDAVEEAVLNRMDSEELQKALMALPPSQQAALRLRYFEGLSLKEIGDKTNVSDKAVKSRLHRAISGLRRILTRRELYDES